MGGSPCCVDEGSGANASVGEGNEKVQLARHRPLPSRWNPERTMITNGQTPSNPRRHTPGRRSGHRRDGRQPHPGPWGPGRQRAGHTRGQARCAEGRALFVVLLSLCVFVCGCVRACVHACVLACVSSPADASPGTCRVRHGWHAQSSFQSLALPVTWQTKGNPPPIDQPHRRRPFPPPFRPVCGRRRV